MEKKKMHNIGIEKPVFDRFKALADKKGVLMYKLFEFMFDFYVEGTKLIPLTKESEKLLDEARGFLGYKIQIEKEKEDDSQ